MGVDLPTHLDVRVPAGWKRQEGAEGPLTWVKNSFGQHGLLQASVHRISPTASLATEAARLGTALEWGTVVANDEGSCEYGRFGKAVFDNGRCSDARIWIVAAEGADTVVFTWVSDSGSNAASVEAEQIVLGARVMPGSLEAFIPAVLGGTRSDFEQDGQIVPAAILYADGTIVFLPIGSTAPEFFDAFVEAIRHEVTKAKAHTVAVVFEVAVNLANGDRRDAVSIYFERGAERKRFLLPLEETGDGKRKLGAAYNVEPAPVGCLHDLFAPADLAKLRAAFPDTPP